MQTEELLSKLDLIEEHARLTIDDFPQLTKERQQMIIALVKQVRWLIADRKSTRLNSSPSRRRSPPLVR